MCIRCEINDLVTDGAWDRLAGLVDDLRHGRRTYTPGEDLHVLDPAEDEGVVIPIVPDRDPPEIGDLWEGPGGRTFRWDGSVWGPSEPPP
ncbi:MULTISPECIES: hypothetical protein [unclassified Geodermatophilus]